MALAFDAVGPAGTTGTAGASASPSWTHVVTGTGNVLLAAVACDNDATTITAITYGAAAMTPLFSGALNYKHSNGAGVGWVAVFKLVNATAGTASVSVTLSVSSTWEAGSLSFSGADTVSGIGTPVSAVGSSTTPSVAVAANTSGNLIAAFLVNGSFINSATAPATSRFINNTGGSNAGGMAAGETAPATGSSVTMAWTVNTDFWAVVAAEVLAGGGASASAVRPAGAGAALNPAIQTSNVNVGPNYAGAAADLGGVYGSWGTPQYATGGP